MLVKIGTSISKTGESTVGTAVVALVATILVIGGTIVALAYTKNDQLNIGAYLGFMGLLLTNVVTLINSHVTRKNTNPSPPDSSTDTTTQNPSDGGNTQP